MTPIELAQSDYIYHRNKFNKTQNAYHRKLMITARDKYQRLQWEKEVKQKNQTIK